MGVLALENFIPTPPIVPEETVVERPGVSPPIQQTSFAPGDKVREVYDVEWFFDPPGVNEIGLEIRNRSNMDLVSVAYLSQDAATRTGRLEIIYIVRPIESKVFGGLAVGAVLVGIFFNVSLFLAERLVTALGKTGETLGGTAVSVTSGIVLIALAILAVALITGQGKRRLITI